MSCQQVPTAPAFNPYPRSVQVGEFEMAIDGGIWVAIRVLEVDLLGVLSAVGRIQGALVPEARQIKHIFEKPVDLIGQLGDLRSASYQRNPTV
jgi:hypothetical protein